jgi:hypothetical protein
MQPLGGETEIIVCSDFSCLSVALLSAIAVSSECVSERVRERFGRCNIS